MSTPIIHGRGNHGGSHHDGGGITVDISIIITVGICAVIAGKYVELPKDKKLESLAMFARDQFLTWSSFRSDRRKR